MADDVVAAVLSRLCNISSHRAVTHPDAVHVGDHVVASQTARNRSLENARDARPERVIRKLDVSELERVADRIGPEYDHVRHLASDIPIPGRLDDANVARGTRGPMSRLEPLHRALPAHRVGARPHDRVRWRAAHGARGLGQHSPGVMHTRFGIAMRMYAKDAHASSECRRRRPRRRRRDWCVCGRAAQQHSRRTAHGSTCSLHTSTSPALS